MTNARPMKPMHVPRAGVFGVPAQLPRGREKWLVALGVFTVFALGIFYPVLSAVLLVSVICAVTNSKNFAFYAVMVLLIGILGWMNASKTPVSDWGWYTNHFKIINTIPFSQYYGSRIGMVTIKYTEPVYYSLSYVLSRLVGGDGYYLGWFVTIAIYGMAGIALKMAIAREQPSATQTGIIIFASLFLGVTFTLTAHLVRQEIAMAMMTLAAVIYLYRSRVVGIALVALSVLTHNSALVPAAVFLCTMSLTGEGNRLQKTKIIFLGFVFFGVGKFLLTMPRFIDLNRNDGSISIISYVVDAVIFVGFLYFKRYLRRSRALAEFLTYATVFYAIFILSISDSPLMVLRMYFYFDSMRLLMLGCIFLSIVHTRVFPIVAPIILAVSVFYVDLRIDSSPFYYGGDVLDYLTTSLAGEK